MPFLAPIAGAVAGAVGSAAGAIGTVATAVGGAMGASGAAAGILGGLSIASTVGGVATSIASSVMSSDAAAKQQALAEQQHVMNKRIAYEKWAYILQDESKQVSDMQREIRSRISSQTTAATQSGGGNLRFGGMKAMTIRNAARATEDIFFNTEQRRIGFGLQEGEVQDVLSIGGSIAYMAKHMFDDTAEGHDIRKRLSKPSKTSAGDIRKLEWEHWSDATQQHVGLNTYEEKARWITGVFDGAGWDLFQGGTPASGTAHTAWETYNQYERMGLTSDPSTTQLTEAQMQEAVPVGQEIPTSSISGSILVRPGVQDAGLPNQLTGTQLKRRNQPKSKVSGY